MYICGIYIPPSNSNHFNSDIFDELENDILNCTSQGSILLMGDFNSRTGKFSDSVCHNGNDFITNDQSASSLNLTRRNSYDNELNNHGKRLLDICKSSDLKILNDRVSGDTLRRATFDERNGVSVIDYAICDQDTLLNVANFVVQQPSSFPDHSSIITWININTGMPEINSPRENGNQLSPLPMQFLWEKDSEPKFRQILRTAEFQMLIQEFFDGDTPIQNVNTTLGKVENILIAAAKRCLKIRKNKKRHIEPLSNKKWFDRDYRLKKHELRELSNQKHRDPLNATLREKYHDV